MNDLIMNCNCHQFAQPGNEIQADITQQVIMPCDPETIARMFAEYYPQKLVAGTSQAERHYFGGRALPGRSDQVGARCGVPARGGC